ncbi:unnamed protein product [Urochloa humidicola]
MPSAMVDATAATPPLDLIGRRRRRRCPAALSNSNTTCVAAALSDANAGAASRKPKSKNVASRYLTPSTTRSPPAASAEPPRPAPPSAVAADAVATSWSAATTTRTLAVAFQSPTYSLETTRPARPASPAVAAAATPTPEKKMPGSTPGTTDRAKVFDASQNTYRLPASDGRSALAAKSRERSAPSRKQSASARPAVFHGTPRHASVDGAANEYLLAMSSDDTDTASSSGDGGGAAPPRRSVGSGPRPSPRNVAAVIMSSTARFARDAMGTRSDRFAYAAAPSPSRTSATASPAPAPAPVKKRSLFNGLLSAPFGRSSPSKPAARSSFRRTVSPSPARRSTGEAHAGQDFFCRLRLQR